MFRRLPHNLRRPRPQDVVPVAGPEAPQEQTPEQPVAYPRSTVDVYGAIHWLARGTSYRFPNELLKAILSHADYDCIHFRASNDVEDKRGSTRSGNHGPHYIETRPLKYISAHQEPSDHHLEISLNALEQGRIRRMVCRATGHDQGWVQDREAGSWSWFELRKRSIEDDTPEGHHISTEEGPVIAHNELASTNWQDHELVYDEGHVELAQVDTSRVSQVAKWVQGLQNGDMVSIVPMARFGGWCCHVQKASIDVEVEVWR